MFCVEWDLNIFFLILFFYVLLFHDHAKLKCSAYPRYGLAWYTPVVLVADFSTNVETETYALGALLAKVLHILEELKEPLLLLFCYSDALVCHIYFQRAR